MSESSGGAEAEQQLSQAMSMALSLALSVAVKARQAQAQQARVAQRENEQRQREFAEQAAAERETAAVLWRRVDDRDWIRDHPEQVAQAWASARSWEPLDPRAAEAREKFDLLLRRMYGVEHERVAAAYDSEDYTALAQLLGRTVEVTPIGAEARYWEQVPEEERQEWLERQVWGPEVDENTRIARSAQLADVHQGLPVGVLRQMPAATRQAWMALDAQSEPERRAWLGQWLQRELWGRTDMTEQQREQRAGELAQLQQLDPGEAVQFSPEAWHAYVEQVRQSNTQTAPAGSGAQSQRSTVRGATPEVGQDVEAEADGSEPASADAQRESNEQLQERAAEAVRQAWPEHVATQVTESDAFGAFAHRLGQLEQRGWQMPEVLGMIEGEELIGYDRRGNPIRSSAAFGEYHLKQLDASLPDRGATTAGIDQLERYIAESVAEQHHGQAEEERDGQQRATEVGESPVVGVEGNREGQGEALAHQEAAEQHEAAAGAAEQYAQREAYPDGAEPAQLAGKGYPLGTGDALKQAQRAAAKQGAVTRSTTREHGAERERGGR